MHLYPLCDFVNTFCLQGMRDPISDSNAKVAMLKDHVDRIVIRELDAGILRIHPIPLYVLVLFFPNINIKIIC